MTRKLAPRRRRQRIRLLWVGLWAVFVLSVGFRFYHFASDHWPHYVHDMYQHTHRIAYIHDHWSNPPLGYDMEANQQPFYYWAIAPFYHPPSLDDLDQINLAAFAVCVSTLGMCLVFRAVLYISSWFMRYVILIYAGMTPAFILASTCVGPDIFVTFFGMLCFYLVLRFNRNPSSRFNFWLIMAAVMLGLWTKLSLIIMLAVLPFVFWRAAYKDTTWRPTLVRAAILAVPMAIWFGLTIWHSWDPNSKQFVFFYPILWDYMLIPSVDIHYIFSCNLSDVFIAGQATTTDDTPANVRYSFPNFEYSNMLLGEYGYIGNWGLGVCTRVVLVFGTILPFGLMLAAPAAIFGWPVTKHAAAFNPLFRTAFIIAIGGLCMSLHYVMVYPLTCCADFRFQFADIAWIGYCVARGLDSFPRGNALRIFSNFMLVTYAIACIVLLATNYSLR